MHKLLHHGLTLSGHGCKQVFYLTCSSRHAAKLCPVKILFALPSKSQDLSTTIAFDFVENTISFFLPIFLKDKERLKYISNENYISQKKKKKKELSFLRNRSEVKTFSQTYNKNNFGIYNMYGNITIKIKIINSLNNFTFTHVYVFMLNDRKIISRKIISRISTLSKIFFHN